MKIPPTQNKLHKKPKTILVRSPNWIGDQVLALPFYHQLRSAYPDARIISVCVPWVDAIQFRTLVDDTYVLTPSVKKSLFGRFLGINEHAKKIRERYGAIDWGISLPNSLGAAWLLKQAGAAVRTGYRFDGRGLLLNDGIDLPEDRDGIVHRSQSYLNLIPESVRTAGKATEFFGHYPENVLDERVPGVLNHFDENRFWPSERLPVPDFPYWILAPGATADSRRWPMEYVIHLARDIARETGWKGIVIGGPKEAPLAERLCGIEELNLIDRTARGSIPGLIPLIRGAQFAVTNESGLAHVCALAGAFTQIVCGAADPRRTKPIGPGLVQVAINSVACWPCEKNDCAQTQENQLICLKGIKPDHVWKEIRDGLAKRPLTS